MVGRLIAAAVEDSSRCYITVGMIAKATFGFVRNVKTNEKGTFSSVVFNLLTSNQQVKSP